jgi:hypothetical protein
VEKAGQSVLTTNLPSRLPGGAATIRGAGAQEFAIGGECLRRQLHVHPELLGPSEICLDRRARQAELERDRPQRQPLPPQLDHPRAPEMCTAGETDGREARLRFEKVDPQPKLVEGVGELLHGVAAEDLPLEPAELGVELVEILGDDGADELLEP